MQGREIGCGEQKYLSSTSWPGTQHHSCKADFEGLVWCHKPLRIILRGDSIVGAYVQSRKVTITVAQGSPIFPPET